MAAVWYIGQAASRTVSSKFWEDAGIAGRPTIAWDRSNGWSVPAAELNEAQLELLADDDNFVVSPVDGPRPGYAGGYIDEVSAPATRAWVLQQILEGYTASLSEGAISRIAHAQDLLLNPLSHRGAMTVLRTALATQEQVNIVFLGSSTTSADTTSPANRWINKLAATITENPVLSLSDANTIGRDKLPKGVNVLNGGVSGAASANYVPEARATWAGRMDPSLVVHTIGANDIYNGVTPEVYKQNLLAGINRVESHTTKPVAHLLVHSFARNDLGTNVTKWPLFRQAMMELSAAEPDRIAFLDLSEAFEGVGIPGPDVFSLLMADRVHLNDNGHKVYADMITKAFGFTPAQIKAPAATAPLVINDQFDRANGPIGSTPEGKPWIASGGSYVIEGGVAKTAALGMQGDPITGGTTYFDSGVSDGALAAKVSGANIGILFRADAQGNGYYFMWSGSGGEYRLGLRASDGPFTKIVGTGTALPYTPDVTLRVEMDGPNIRALANGVQVLQLTDTRRNGTHHGLTAAVTGATADFFAVAAKTPFWAK